MCALALTKIQWDIGTAYDLFVSLHALHEPDAFGVRASWAAGVRSRLPADHRQTLDLVIKQISAPLIFVHNLPAPKSAATVIETLKKMPAPRVLEALSFSYQTTPALKETLLNARPGHKWTPAERQILLEQTRLTGQHTQSAYLEGLYQIWSEREAFGEKLIKALEAYIEGFFAEEEQRILPVLKNALSHAQMRAGSQPLPMLLEELSNGVRIEKIDTYAKIVLAPSFWGSPYMLLEKLNPDTLMVVFGARPDTMAIIPGDIVPDALIRSLKALSDATRLRILRYLAQSPHTATELSRALRLRPPTVLHHLNQLRMAGMVQILLSEEGERKFSPRYDGFENTIDLLKLFVQGE
jgi:DNA-binding transcriptional ArsR family regulator